MTRPTPASSTTFSFGRATRSVSFEIGRRYVVAPMNVQAKKHRGRIVTLLGFDDVFMPSFAIVRFEDSQREGKVPRDHLADVGAKPDAKPRPALDELLVRASRLAVRLSTRATPSRMRELRTLSRQLGEATTKENMHQLTAVLGQLMEAAARGTAVVEGRSAEAIAREIAESLSQQR